MMLTALKQGMARARRRRYSGNDAHFGPFTLSRSDGDFRPLGLVLDSGGGEERESGCHLRLHGLGRTLIVELPALIKPWRQWVDTSKYEWARGPNAGYWDVHPNEYGFTVSTGFLQVFHGPQTMDSVTTKNWCAHLPWTQWRFQKVGYYGLTGELLREWVQQRPGMGDFSERYAFEKSMPAVTFRIEDFDGQIVDCRTYIQQNEWKFGTGWFKWLSLFRKTRVRRSLDLSFSKEVGTEKGSWKGGLMGTSIDMLPGELHDDAFRRYCDKEHRDKSGKYRIHFIGRA